MIFIDGYYHADPHPGNIVLLPGNVIGLFDFGMVGRIDEELREDIEEVMLSIVQRDPIHLATLIKRIGTRPRTSTKRRFARISQTLSPSTLISS